MPVPNTFANATGTIPLSQLDNNFATAITVGNTAVQLGNTITTINNVTLPNVTITSGNITNVTVITTGNGTVSAPAHSFGSAAGSGMYLSGANAVTLTTGGANAVTIDSSQNVGIGTTSPAVKLDVNGQVNDSKGDVRSIPQNSQTGAYVLVAADNGKHISITTGGVTVPNGVFTTGQVVSIFNNSTSNQTITQATSVTLRQAGTANTGNRTLAQYGLATILCTSANNFVITGSGVS